MSKNKVENGFVYCTYKRKKNSDELMYASDYGYKAWRIPIRKS